MNAAKQAASALAASTCGVDGRNVSFSVVFVVATPGIKVERIKGIVKCPSHSPLLPCEKKRPLSPHGFDCHNPYCFSWLWNAVAKVVVAAFTCVCVNECAFTCVFLLQPCTGSAQCIGCMCPWYSCWETKQLYHCCVVLKSRKGNTHTQLGQLPKNVPCFISSWGSRVGGMGQRGLYFGLLFM